MTRAHRDIPGSPSDVNMASASPAASSDRTPWFGHSGGFPGYLTRTCVLPSLEVAFSVLTNAIDAPVSSVGRRRDRHPRYVRAARRAERVRSPLDRTLVEHVGRLRSGADGQPRAGRAAEPDHAVLDATELTVRGDVGRITQADGFATFGETARLERDARGRATALWLGGGQFDPHVDDLAETACRSNRAHLNWTDGLSHHRVDAAIAPTNRRRRSIDSSRTSGIGKAHRCRTRKN